MVTEDQNELQITVLGEPEKSHTFENSWHWEYFTDLNDSNSG